MKIFCSSVICVLLSLFTVPKSQAQCGYTTGLGCTSTNPNNYGANSDGVAATIEYDNAVSAFHSSVVREYTGEFKIWGEDASRVGTTNDSVPVVLNAANYYKDANNRLTGTVLKVTLGSNGGGILSGSGVQFVALTTTGLWAWGGPGFVLDNSLTSSSTFQKITVNSKADGLPTGVGPLDVKMMFGTYHSLGILTCDSQVYVLSQSANMRGGTGNSTTWTKISSMKNIVALRGCPTAFFALAGTDSLYTWGDQTYVVGGSRQSRSTPTLVTRPSSNGRIKMIGATVTTNGYPSYYVLYGNGNLYALGDNSKRQLGTWNTTASNTWVQPRYGSSSGQVMNDIKWISPNEHDYFGAAAINVITSATQNQLYNWGDNNYAMLGRGAASNINGSPVDPGVPSGLSATDKILAVETGGHTSMILRKCTGRYGYVGHQINGSMGDSTTADNNIASFTFTKTPVIQPCGATTVPQITITGNPATNTLNQICTSETVQLTPSPAGGTLTVTSGPGVLTGNVLSFTGAGIVTVSYSVIMDECSTTATTATRTFVAGPCVLYNISGYVWKDKDQNGIRSVTELGTNAGTTSSNGLWANLIATDGTIQASTPVALEGMYSLPVSLTGAYSVQLSNSQLGLNVPVSNIPASFFNLPTGWRHTGVNIGGIPNLLNKSGLIGSIVVSSNITGINFGVVDPTTLPLSILSFDARKQNAYAVLEWKTAASQRTAGFGVERSTDGNQWTEIGYQRFRTGTPDNSGKYSFTDMQPATGTNYYRIREYATDGDDSYTAIRILSFNSPAHYSIYPNPATTTVTIDGLKGDEQISIFNSTGRQVLTTSADQSRLNISIENIPVDLYQMVIRDASGNVTTSRLVKLK